jgi:hypothetical protein
MLYPDKEITSVTGLIDNLITDIPAEQKHIWYRGQSKKEWKLISALGRIKKRSEQVENYLIKRFRQNATQLVTIAHTTNWDWLLTMQHHGVPTRLLDWSESPLIGLYFAVCEKPKTDGSIWMLLPSMLNRSSNIEPEYSVDIPSFDDPILENYSTHNLVSERLSHLFPIAVIVPRTNPRIQAQLGVFSIMHRDPIAIEDVGDSKHVWRYNIPANSKINILRELKILGINKFSLFPELPSVGEMVKGEI